MNNLLVTLLCDASLAVLLMVTIGYCARLSKRIRLLQDSRSELGEMITRFDEATGRAMASLAELQTVSKKITEALQIKIEKANFIADDLAFLIERGAKLTAPKDPPKTHPQKSAVLNEPNPSFEAQFVKPRQEPALAEITPAPSSRVSSIEAVLQRLSNPGLGSAVPDMKTPSAATQNVQLARTGAERELLEALKSRY